MKLRFITPEHITEAVKFLVAKGGHLPYTDESGKPNHRLMGAAWAALHGGYRGNKYSGPDKAKAISKLTAIYKSEKMDTPSESLALEGEFFEEGLRADDSFDAIRSRVQAAIDQAIRSGQDMDLDGDDDSQLGGSYALNYAWIRDLFPGTVVYSMDGDMFQCDYTDDGEKVTLGTPQEVEMSYTPVGESVRKESFRAVASEAFCLGEAAYDAAKGQLAVTVIKPGFSKNKTKGRQRYYPAETLKRDYKTFEGAKMFVDHQTESEAKARPEGSVHDWVATLGKTWAESDGTVKSTATVIDPTFKSKLDRLNEAGLITQMAVSSRHAAECSEGVIAGQEAMIMESIVAVKSVDFVTHAGAGGQVDAMESDSRNNDEWDVDLISESELRKRRPDLVTLIESSSQGAKEQMKTLEQQLQESNTQLAAEKKRADEATTKLQESEKASKKATAAVELVKLLTESKLPEKAQERLKKQFSEAVTVEGMKEAIESEKEYVKSFSGGTNVRNLGKEHSGTQESGDKDTRKILKESFMAAGMTEKDAEIAAAGRR